MRMHPIEVDDEVYSYLKEKAEAFVDTPNSVLRRDLLQDAIRPTEERNESRSNGGHLLPAFPTGTPKVLQYVLEVVYLVRNYNRSRPSATGEVAATHQRKWPTVFDKYTRQLDLNALKFDRLLEQPDLRDLKVLLNKQFSDHHGVIREYLGE